jgi:hypothetical protein
MYIAIAIAVIIGSLLIQFLVAGPRQFRKKAQFLTEYAARKGYRLANPSIAQVTGASARDILTNPSLKSYIKGSEGITDIKGLERATDDPFAITGSIRSKDVMIFDLSVTSQRSDDRGTDIQYKVAKIAQAELPRFSLGKRSVVSTVISAVDKLTGKAEANIDVDPRNFPEFAKHYWLKGPDGNAVLSFLSSEKIIFLESTQLVGTIATNSRYFVYFESGSFKTEHDYDSFIEMVQKLATNLL